MNANGNHKEEGKVLIVDDDQLLLDMYAKKFKDSGYTVEVAVDSKGALQKVQGGFTPDILLLDVVMPGVDGFELLASLKKEATLSHSTAIMLSNQGGDADVEQAKKLGADCYIVKASAVPSEVVDRAAQCREAHQHAA